MSKSDGVIEVKDPMGEGSDGEFDPEEQKAVFGQSNWKSIRVQISDAELDSESLVPIYKRKKSKASTLEREKKRKSKKNSVPKDENEPAVALPPSSPVGVTTNGLIEEAPGVTEIKLDEEEGSGSGDEEVINSLRNLRTATTGNIAAFAEKLAEENVAIKYRDEYLNKNTLEVLLEAFGMLDSTINLFFFTYSGLKRSSYTCAQIWLYIMKIRMLMNDSINHLVESPHLLSPGFRESRNLHILAVRESSKAVARAVQYLVTFTQHSEEWKFHRNGFLKDLGEEIAKVAEKNSKEWVNFEVKMHEMTQMTKKSYEAHVEIEELKIIRSLLEVQPKSDIAKNDDQYLVSLEAMIRDLKNVKRQTDDGNILKAFNENRPYVTPKVRQIIHNNFWKFRIQLNIVKDIQGMSKFVQKLPEGITFEEDNSLYQSGLELLEEQLGMNVLDHVLTEDQTIWPHQRGVKQVGPYRVLPLRTPELFLDVDMEKLKYTPRPNGVDAMGCFTGFTGIVTKPTPITVGTKGSDKEMRNSLKIPLKAKYYSFFHPIDKNWGELWAKHGGEGVNKMVDEVNDMIRDLSPIHAVCGHGAFGYFDKDYKLLQLNGLAMGEDLFFDGPYFLPNKSGFQLINDVGVEMSPVTLEELDEGGAENHGWLSTKEELSVFKRNGEEFFFPGEEKPFGGAFFFEYNNSRFPQWDKEDAPEGARRNYFQLMPFQELSLKKMQNRNTPILTQLAYEIALKKDDWDVMREHRTKEELGNLRDVIKSKKRKDKGKRCIIM